MNQVTNWYNQAIEMAIEYAPKVVGAILVYIIGSYLISKLGKMLRRVMMLRQYDPALQSFLINLATGLSYILLFLTVASMIGINTTSFAALIAGIGIAIGAALNGSLGNVAGGVMLIIFKPFKIGDIIEAQGYIGTVIEIGLVATVVVTPENKTIYIPNGALSTGSIANFKTQGSLRVDLKIFIPATESIDKAREVAMAAITAHPNVLTSPAPSVHVGEVVDNTIKLVMHPFTTQENYWSVYFGVQENVKKAFDSNGIDSPIPHRIMIDQRQTE